GIYGDAYGLAPPNDSLVLRQTACLQKFAVARDWELGPEVLPRCLYELSDSYRREVDGQDELCFRIRRFRVPEAHLHAVSLDESVEIGLGAHRIFVGHLQRTVSEFVMLVTATENFARQYRAWLLQLAQIAKQPLLLHVVDGICQDGVEV